MTDSFPRQGRIAGIDYGTVRIGVALTDASQILASPYETYTRRSAEEDARWFRQLVDREDIVGFVVGLPVHASGEESKMSSESRQFGQWLEQMTSRPVCFYDERFTSIEADQHLNLAQLTKKKRQKRLDMVSAQIMLASFLSRKDAAEPRALED
jgi:putative Holliday junction resolvase